MDDLSGPGILVVACACFGAATMPPAAFAGLAALAVLVAAISAIVSRLEAPDDQE
jgi:hypothetical protein